jgi:hypothetical protein
MVKQMLALLVSGCCTLLFSAVNDPAKGVVAGNGFVDDLSYIIQYAGNWSGGVSDSTGTTTGYHHSSGHYSKTVGNSASLTFSGTQIKWIGWQNV